MSIHERASAAPEQKFKQDPSERRNMGMRRFGSAACLSTLLFFLLGVESANSQPRCTANPLAAADVLFCALARSPKVRTEQEALQALSGRRLTAGTLLPAHPVIALSLAQRRPQELISETTNSVTFLNWYLTLSQEIEIAGQRSVRLDIADAALAAQVRRVSVAQQDTAAAALSAYYHLLAAGEEQRLADELGEIANALFRLAAARAEQALLSPVDADVAQAEASRLRLVRAESRQRTFAARAVLVSLLGLAPSVFVEVLGDLQPDPQLIPEPAAGLDALVQRALTLRGDLHAATLERAVSEQQVRLLARTRIPNLTLSAFAQRDGFNELVIGGGLSLPLPLPAPLGPSRRGEIVEARAHTAQAESEIERIRRRIQLEVTQAFYAHQAQTAALQLIPSELVQRARTDLRAIAQAVATRQLPLREALLSQRSLIELLQAHIKNRYELALARVELLRATGLLLQEERP